MDELKVNSDKNIIFKDLMDVKVENYRKLFFVYSLKQITSISISYYLCILLKQCLPSLNLLFNLFSNSLPRVLYYRWTLQIHPNTNSVY